jgi:hypothetical protein
VPRAGVPSRGPLSRLCSSFAFTLGNAGQSGYLRGRLAVTPGISCSSEILGFPLFGGVSRQKEYFSLTVTEGHADAADFSFDQWPKELRIHFDNGQVITTDDAPLAGKPPAGAKRIVQIEMDFRGGDSDKANARLGGGPINGVGGRVALGQPP